jgi:adenylylsulfate kinase-like enzyme
VSEDPENPGIVLETDKTSLEERVETILNYLIENEYMKQ